MTLGVVNKIADYIYVMKNGKIIEHGEKHLKFLIILKSNTYPTTVSRFSK